MRLLPEKLNMIVGEEGKIEIRQQLERLRQFGFADAVGNAALFSSVGFKGDDFGQKVLKSQVFIVSARSI
jgi:hypothetical protein